MEYATGAMAGVMAVCFTNPLDVVKTRLQLQGELKARKQHVIHYKNTFHAFYTIAKNDGILAIQKGNLLRSLGVIFMPFSMFFFSHYKV